MLAALSVVAHRLHLSSGAGLIVTKHKGPRMTFKAAYIWVALSIVVAPAALAGEDAARPHADGASEGKMGQTFMTGIVALMDYCKQIEPARAAAIDADWAKGQADLEPDMRAHIASPEFAVSVAARVKELTAAAQDAAEAASLKDTCAQMAAGK